MAEIDVEEQILLSETVNRRNRRHLAFSILVLVIATTVGIISTLIYTHMTNFKSKKCECDKPLQVDMSIIPEKITPPDKVVDILGPSTPFEKIIPSDIHVISPPPKEQIKKRLSKKEILNGLLDLAQKNQIKIVKGDYQTCRSGKCPAPIGKSVNEWKLSLVSEILEGESQVDFDRELQKIINYDKHNDIYGIYYDSEDQYKKTYIIFNKNAQKVEAHNKDPKRLFNMELTMFAAYAEDESELSHYPIKKPVNMTKSTAGIKRDENQIIHKDWRDESMVTKIIFQGSCGSCWAMAAVDTFNSFMSIKRKKLMNFSYQQVVDCTSSKYTCEDGGNHLKALEYIKGNKLCCENDYKYKNKKTECSVGKCNNSSEIKEIRKLENEDQLEFLANNGPILVSFKTSTNFLLYKDGIYDGSCETGNGHSVVVVGHGYDKEKKVNYWIVKNSWGEYWGEQGYFRIIDRKTFQDGRYKHHCDLFGDSYGLL